VRSPWCQQFIVAAPKGLENPYMDNFRNLLLFHKLKVINKHMHPNDLRRFIKAVDIQEPYETLWNSETVLNRINELLDPLKFSGPYYSEWENQPCMDWFRTVKNSPPTKIWLSLCKRDYSVDIWVCVTVGDDETSVFEYKDDPPATVSAVMFSVARAARIAQEKLALLQRLVEPVKTQ